MEVPYPFPDVRPRAPVIKNGFSESVTRKNIGLRAGPTANCVIMGTWGTCHAGVANVHQMAVSVHQTMSRMQHGLLIIIDKPSTSGNAKSKHVIMYIM